MIRMDYVGGATVFRLKLYLQIEVQYMEEQFAKIIVEYSFMQMMVSLKLMEIK